MTKTIEKIELIKIEKERFSRVERYFYNIYLSGINEPLLVSDLGSKLDSSLVGKQIKYRFNEENIIEDFDIK
jgi:hypothetical protein